MRCNIGRGLLVKKIVIVGGGAAGLELAIKLGRSIGKKKTAEILLLDKERILVISKSDLISESVLIAIKNKLNSNLKGITTHFISSVSNSGIQELKDLIWEKLNTN